MAAPVSRKGGRTGRARPRKEGERAEKQGKGAGVVVFDLDRYGGKWVATRRGQVVASADDFAAIRRAVRELGIEEDAILTRVPETGEFTY